MAGSLPIVYSPAYEVDIGAHVFPTRKYRLVLKRLLADGVIGEEQVFAPTAASDAEVGWVHTTEYLRKIREDALSYQERLVLEVPFSDALLKAMWLCAGGTLLTARLALTHGRAVHLGGGFHHAFPDHGEGFCLINDVAIALRALRRAGEVARALVIDLDVHHGNGTAAIFQGDDAVYTFSMHEERNYPAWKPPSDRDVGLETGLGDHEYLALLDRHLREILELHRPGLAFYLAGADPYTDDQLGGLGLTISGLRQRDALVFELTRQFAVPVAVTLAGGYAREPDDTVTIHSNTVREAVAMRDG